MWPVDSVAVALTNVVGGRHPHVLVLDARDVTDRRAALEAVQAQSPRTVVVVFAEDAIKVQRAAALKGTRLFAVLPPKSSRRLIDYSTTHSNTDVRERSSPSSDVF